MIRLLVGWLAGWVAVNDDKIKAKKSAAAGAESWLRESEERRGVVSFLWRSEGLASFFIMGTLPLPSYRLFGPCLCCLCSSSLLDDLTSSLFAISKIDVDSSRACGRSKKQLKIIATILSCLCF